MASYTNSPDHYVTQLNPVEDDIQFDAQVLQTKQSSYDKGHEQISELYGSVLNSALTRTDNTLAKEEFFKTIQNDIRKMGGLDFSLQANVQKAGSVFKSIYTNKGIVKDMVWTKNYMKETQKGQMLKDCNDEEKCGGKHWDIGDQYMELKRSEFSNATAQDALSFNDVSYIPYKETYAKALKTFNDSKLSMETDYVSGGYVITQTNGSQIIQPLTALFTNVFSNDPSFFEMFKAQAYVERKSWMSQKINEGSYQNEGEALHGYMTENHQAAMKNIKSAQSDLRMDNDSLESSISILKAKAERNEIEEGSDDHKKLVELMRLKQSSDEASDYLEKTISLGENINNAGTVYATGDLLDRQLASSLLINDVNKNANILSYSGFKTKKTADEYKILEAKHHYDLQLKQVGFQNDVNMEAIKFENTKEKILLNASLSSTSGNTTAKDAESLLKAQEELKKNDIGKNPAAYKLLVYAKLKNDTSFSTAGGTEALVNEYVNALKKGTGAKYLEDKAATVVAKLKKAVENVNLDGNTQRRSALVAALKLNYNDIDVGILASGSYLMYADLSETDKRIRLDKIASAYGIDSDNFYQKAMLTTGKALSEIAQGIKNKSN